jgi:hypothetical protein
MSYHEAYTEKEFIGRGNYGKDGLRQARST